MTTHTVYGESPVDFGKYRGQPRLRGVAYRTFFSGHHMFGRLTACHFSVMTSGTSPQDACMVYHIVRHRPHRCGMASLTGVRCWHVTYVFTTCAASFVTIHASLRCLPMVKKGRSPCDANAMTFRTDQVGDNMSDRRLACGQGPVMT